jgi:hypothetical protein
MTYGSNNSAGIELTEIKQSIINSMRLDNGDTGCPRIIITLNLKYHDISHPG